MAMKILRVSVWPGTLVTVFLETSALFFLGFHSSAYTGILGTWDFVLVAVSLLPLITVLMSLVVDKDRRLRWLLVKGMLVFLATLPETALLPVRWLLFSALVAQSCSVLPSLWKLPISALFLAELFLVHYCFSGMTTQSPDLVSMAVVLVCILIPGFLLHIIQDLATRLEEVSDRNEKLHTSVLQLTSANTEFLEQANVAGEESAVLERHRITRDLHDVVGQTLTNIIMMMDAALHRKVHEPEETVKLLRWIRKQAQSGLEETRAVLYELRALRPATLRGLRALKKLIETFSRLSRIKTTVEWGNLPWTFAPDQENAVYHLIQASLSNSFRHGSATRIDIHFNVDRGVLHVLVRDNGRGGSDASSGIGQRGMEERLIPWGGTVSFHSEPFGYAVTAALPLVTEPAKEAESGSCPNPHRR